jgi:hypothetical protein
MVVESGGSGEPPASDLDPGVLVELEPLELDTFIDRGHDLIHRPEAYRRKYALRSANIGQAIAA